MAEVCVVIPIYKASLSDFEKISFQQCIRVLKNHPIIIAKPQNLDLTFLKTEYNDLQFESFDDSYFKNVSSYNKLMLETVFYQRFEDYKYTLIYQLDAFVFQDDLHFWTSQNYDYIGAPWRIEIEFESKFKEFVWNLKKQFALKFDLKEEKYGKFGPREIIFKRTVGNGGFSLRKNAKMIEVINQNKAKVNYYINHCDKHAGYNEDSFFSLEVNRYFNVLKIPNWKKALGFAVEQLPQKGIKINNGIPFGCHAWDKYDTDFWLDYFKTLGYKVD